MKVTHTQIAKKLNVDRTTVSKVLSGYQLERFTSDVIERIQSTALAMGYKPKKFKSSLDITFIFPDYAGMLQYYSYSQRTLESIIGISECIAGTSNRFHLAKYSGTVDESILYGDAFIVWEMSGNTKLLDAIAETGKEVLILNRAGKDFNGSFVVHDSDAFIKMSIDTLWEANHRKIAYVGFPRREGLDSDYDGFKLYMESEKGAEMGEFFQFDLDSDVEQIEKIAHQIKDGGYTAFVAADDNKALKVINALLKLGVRIPEDISVIGNHKIETCFDLPVDLTSYVTSWREIGQRGAEVLLNRSKLGEGASKVPAQEYIQPQFYPGATVRTL